jgi:hypothetical protein
MHPFSFYRSALAVMFVCIASLNGVPVSASAANTGSADDTGLPQTLGGPTPTTTIEPPSTGISGYDPFSPVQACAQMCSCSCPAGASVTATPSAAALAAAANAPNGEGVKHPAGPEGANSSGSPHGSYRHGRGMYGYSSMVASDETHGYPVSFVDRPLVLPSGITQPEFAVAFFNDFINTASPVNARIQLGSQTGVADGWQAGALVNLVTRPKVTIDSLMLTGHYALLPQLSARLDVGARHAVCPGGLGNSFAGGVGLPFKLALNPHLALVSGRATVSSYEEDLVTWDAKGCGSNFTLGVPIGVQASLAQDFNFSVRSGYRQLLGNGASTGFVPLSVDFAYVISGQADVGLSFVLPNALGAPADLDRAQSQRFEQRLTVFAQTRL